MKIKHKKLTKLGIFSGLLLVPFAVTFLTQYKPPLSDDYSSPVQTGPLTDKQKLMNSLTNIKAFEATGDIKVISKKNEKINVSLKAEGDLSDLSDIQLQGKIDLDIDNSRMDANFGYFDHNLYFDYRDSYFKLETSSLLNFVGMLPEKFNFSSSLPPALLDFDVSSIMSYLDDMSDKQEDVTGGYFFTIDITDDIHLDILADEEINFAGFRTGRIDYNGTIINLNVELKRLDDVTLSNPADDSTKLAKYQDFSPAFKLFDGFYNLSQKKKNNIKLSLDIDKESAPNTYAKFLDLDAKISYDLESEQHLYALEGEISVEKKVITKVEESEVTSYVERKTPFNFAFQNKTIYAQVGDVAISTTTQELNNLIEYILHLVGDDKINSLISSLSESMGNLDLGDTMDKVKELFNSLTISGNQVALYLNTSIFSKDADVDNGTKALNLSDAAIVVNFDENSGDLKDLRLENFVINDYKASIIVDFGNYSDFVLVPSKYQQIDHLYKLSGLYEFYKDQTKYRFDFDSKISKADTTDDHGVVTSYNDVLVNGGLQFELDPERLEENHINVGYGYGDVTITDRKNVKHKIFADMKSVDEILMRYSTVTNNSTKDANTDPLYVKMKVQTMKDIVDLGQEIVKEEDEHFKEITGKLFDSLAYLPIKDIIENKEYQRILGYDIIDKFEVGSNYIDLGIVMDILSLEGVRCDIRIEFDVESEETFALKALKISGLTINGLTLEFNAYLHDFNPALASTRLSQGHDYIDFSDLKVLLRLGINTSKNNYYHFTATASVKMKVFGLSLGDLSIDIPMDIKIWSKSGDVHVSVDMMNLPTSSLVVDPADGYASLSKRDAHIYYHDGYFYVNRIDECKTTGLIWGWFGKNVTLDYQAKYDTKDFMDNVLQILLGDTIGVKSTYMNLINDAIEKNQDDSYQMKYEKILKDFAYSKTGHYFYFDLDVAEMANNDQLSELSAMIYTDNTDVNLTAVNAKLGVDLTVITINVTLDLSLADSSLVADNSNRLTAQEAFTASLADKQSGYTHTTETSR